MIRFGESKYHAIPTQSFPAIAIIAEPLYDSIDYFSIVTITTCIHPNQAYKIAHHFDKLRFLQSPSQVIAFCHIKTGLILSESGMQKNDFLMVSVLSSILELFYF